MTHSRPHRTQERKSRDFPGSLMMKTVLPRQGMQVGSLLRELRAHMVKKKKENKQTKKNRKKESKSSIWIEHLKSRCIFRHEG